MNKPKSLVSKNQGKYRNSTDFTSYFYRLVIAGHNHQVYNMAPLEPFATLVLCSCERHHSHLGWPVKGDAVSMATPRLIIKESPRLHPFTHPPHQTPTHSAPARGTVTLMSVPTPPQYLLHLYIYFLFTLWPTHPLIPLIPLPKFPWRLFTL